MNIKAHITIDLVNWMFKAQSDVISLLKGKTVSITIDEYSKLPLDYYSLGYCMQEWLVAYLSSSQIPSDLPPSHIPPNPTLTTELVHGFDPVVYHLLAVLFGPALYNSLVFIFVIQ